MSGHNKWSTIKHKKGAADAKRGKIFTKIIKEISVAAKLGGGDPDGNPRLRTAIDKAKAENMPKDNIERAIKKGTGGMEGVNYEEITYEGYGPGGVAVLVEVMTDNRNRTVSDVRSIFTKCNGNMGETGCVSWIFDKKGLIVFPKATDFDKLFEAALEAGADDVSEEEEQIEVTHRSLHLHRGPGGPGKGRIQIRIRRGHHDSPDHGEAGREAGREHAEADGPAGR